jgi:hypothetical protein
MTPLLSSGSLTVSFWLVTTSENNLGIHGPFIEN